MPVHVCCGGSLQRREQRHGIKIQKLRQKQHALSQEQHIRRARLAELRAKREGLGGGARQVKRKKRASRDGRALV